MANNMTDTPQSRLVFDLQLAGRLHAAAQVCDGITAVFGPSGAGKTTLLRSLAGLQNLQTAALGSVLFDGIRWQQSGRQWLATEKRQIGYVAQRPALFHHMTVAENLQFATKRAASPLSANEALLDFLVEESWLEKPVTTLSGGEAQRVAIAQALLSNPQLLLLDEPLSGLDAATKAKLMPTLRDLLITLKIPTLLVTHSPLEVAALADQVLLMRGGVIERQAAVADVLPAIVARNIDQPLSMLEATVIGVDHEDQLIELACGEATLWLPVASRPSAARGDAVRLIIYARDVSMSRETTALDSASGSISSSILNRVKVVIESIDTTGHQGAAELQLCFGGGHLIATITQRSLRGMQLAAGQMLWAQIKSVSLG